MPEFPNTPIRAMLDGPVLGGRMRAVPGRDKADSHRPARARLPRGTELQVRPRSGLSLKHGIPY